MKKDINSFEYFEEMCDCWSRDDLLHRCYELCKEVSAKNQQIIIMEKYLELIHDLGYDYDGFNYEKDLKSLIDEMCRYASLGRACNTTEPIFVDRDKEYNILNEEIGVEDEFK